jgi:hypothetical protein
MSNDDFNIREEAGHTGDKELIKSCDRNHSMILLVKNKC